MKSRMFGVLVALGAFSAAPAAYAAADYYLKIEDIKGENEGIAQPIEILSWSWGASNPSTMSGPASQGRVTAPRDAASGLATGRRQGSPSVTASQNTQSLRESPTRKSTGQTAVRVATGDVTGDGMPDLAAAAAQDEIQGFTLRFDKASPILARVCSGKHFPTVTLSPRRTSSSPDEYVLENIQVTSCADTGQPADASSSGGMGAGKASMSDLNVMRQTQGATFGERCAAGQCTASGDVTVTITGQMKHTKTGHVTLLK